MSRFKKKERQRSKVFFKNNYAENVTEKIAPDLFSFFKKALFEVKASGQDLSCNVFW